MSIGAVEQSAPEKRAKDVLFALPIDVALCPAGDDMLIADMYDNVLTNVGREGNVLWRARAARQGPGEFRRLYRVTCANDGTAIAYDIASQEISRFSPTGEFVERGRLDVRMAFVDRMVSLPNRKIAIAGIARNDHSIDVVRRAIQIGLARPNKSRTSNREAPK